ncbi:PQ loop repeat family protein [Tritrichomonas foetus]|uniref:PQ loop repeat family protein n=1 Tax=Tritrichomonas foetus TaxID=1144522 RepID=A0A1J4K7P8_9EUKA|nr:PQ loop repeat family protein [Tritrichomonas foetus]|eukprot:OHT05445.1 PQ loop repeat family protein [Tritrichomonas foetus]
MSCDEGAIKWIATAFGDCIYTPRDQLSFWVGMISNVIWIISASPQYYRNCVSKNVDGQSPFFSSLIFAGNVLSLVGVFVTHGLPTQIITQVLYVILDGLLFAQYLMFRFCCRKPLPDEESVESIDGENKGEISDLEKNYDESSSTPTPSEQVKEEGINSPSMIGGVAMLVAQAAATATNTTRGAPVAPSSGIDYGIPYRGDNLIGSLFGWAGTAIYIGSRVPQVIKNFKEGVSSFSALYMLFMLLGNLTYALSIFIRSLDPDFLWLQTPFIVGALFPMTCDGITFFQIIIGRCRKPKEDGKDSGFVSSDEEDRRISEI